MYGYDDYEIDNYYDGDEETLNVNLSEDQEKLLGYINMNQVEEVKAMLKNGINVNYSNKYGETPLMRAVGKNDILKLLLNYGANTEAKNLSGRTALDEALFNYEGEDEGVYRDIYKESIDIIKREPTTKKERAKKERLKYLSFIKLMNENEPVNKDEFSSSAIHQLFKNAPKDVIDAVVKKAVMMEGKSSKKRKSAKKRKSTKKRKSVKKGKKRVILCK